nr:MAG TPA: hypothetical protein [Caudoviricetes sp.]
MRTAGSFLQRGFGKPHKKPRLGAWPWAGCKDVLNSAITRAERGQISC